jgi:hypothetical protein
VVIVKFLMGVNDIKSVWALVEEPSVYEPSQSCPVFLKLPLQPRLPLIRSVNQLFYFR